MNTTDPNRTVLNTNGLTLDHSAKLKRLAFPWIPFLKSMLLSGFLVLAVAALSNPFGSRVQVRGQQTKSLAQCKQIGLALKIYADDHDGVYPAGINSVGETIRSSNDAFRSLFPNYTQSETIFGNKLAVGYQTGNGPDNKIDDPPRNPAVETLAPGENVYGYVMGVTDKMPGATTPLVFDGTDGTGRGVYVSDQHACGGVWKGTKAIVIYLDNHGAVENLTGPDDARFIAIHGPDGKVRNLLAPATLGPALKFLDPAVAPAGKPR